MKSVIQESSSVFKAIEQGWEKAGKPHEFTVKILQEAKKNFLGMTLSNAKVAIFFGEPIATHQKTPSQDYRQRQQSQQARMHQQHMRRPRRRPQQQQQPQQQQTQAPQQNPNKPSQ